MVSTHCRLVIFRRNLAIQLLRFLDLKKFECRSAESKKIKPSIRNRSLLVRVQSFIAWNRVVKMVQNVNFDKFDQHYLWICDKLWSISGVNRYLSFGFEINYFFTSLLFNAVNFVRLFSNPQASFIFVHKTF